MKNKSFLLLFLIILLINGCGKNDNATGKIQYRPSKTIDPSSIVVDTTSTFNINASKNKLVNFKISEFGINLILPDWVAEDLSYERYKFIDFKNTKDDSVYLGLSSKKLIKLGNPNCKIPGSLGRIVKSKKIFAEGSDEETIDPIPSINKKINDYYISFYGPQEGCIKNPENSSSPSAKWLYAELNEIFKAWERFTGIKRNIF